MGERFRCFACTVEQPFKDVAANPDRFRGWSPGRSMLFGGVGLQAVHAVLTKMRAQQQQQAEGGEGGEAGQAGEPPAKKARGGA